MTIVVLYYYIVSKVPMFKRDRLIPWYHNIQQNDTQHNDIQHNYSQHKGFTCDTTLMTFSTMALEIECCYAQHHYAECHDLLIIMLNTIMLSVAMLNTECNHQSFSQDCQNQYSDDTKPAQSRQYNIVMIP
jgi:hypothetical protein